MVSAPIVVLTAVAIIFILQMITMIQVRKLKKAIGGVKNEEPGFSNQKFQQKDREIIRDKRRVDRPQVQDTQIKPQTPITSVERSLRDINLRLKNAERDQERARRKMGKHEDRPRDNRPHGNRPHDKRTYDKRPMNDGSKQMFKRRDYNEKVIPKPQEPVPTVPEENRPLDFVPPPVLTPPVLKEEIPSEAKQTEFVDPVIEKAGSPEQGFGRGTKITVKRRALNGEGAEPEKVSDEQNVSASAVNTETPGEQNISFGRK